jgi:A/G-specific adenine glycosylase
MWTRYSQACTGPAFEFLLPWLPARVSFTENLLAWGRLHGRTDLPWQQETKGRLNVYWVWVSEVMLQQTQVQTVRNYFLAFIGRFPNRASLAQAPLDDVLAAWSGLGYYRRARNLHAAACLLERHYPEGGWPRTRQAWQDLPGLGRSTAAAIVSSCFQAREPILDGNVKRVLARQVCAEQPWGSAALDRLLWEEAERRLPVKATDMPLYIQSLMDLGATLCLPKRPDCGRCPVRKDCQAYSKGESLAFPRPKPSKVRPVRKEHWLVCLRSEGLKASARSGSRGRFQLALQQQPEQGVWAGLWSFPALDASASLPKGWVQWMAFHHDFSHFRLLVSLWVPSWFIQDRADQPSGPLLVNDDLAGDARLFTAQRLSYRLVSDWLEQGIPSPVRRILEKLAKAFEA